MSGQLMTSRRSLLAGAVAMAASPVGCAHQAISIAFPAFDDLKDSLPETLPQPHLVLEILAEVGEAYSLGEGPHGEQRIVPITGGHFRGSGLSGVVLPGGADRQLVRGDGIRELDATYELKAEDGTLIMVRNRALVDAQRAPAGWDRYVRSVVQLVVPKGRHDWLNRRVVVGTLHSMRPAKPLVLLRFYVLE